LALAIRGGSFGTRHSDFAISLLDSWFSPKSHSDRFLGGKPESQEPPLGFFWKLTPGTWGFATAVGFFGIWPLGFLKTVGPRAGLDFHLRTPLVMNFAA
jgi:hypothetical protein